MREETSNWRDFTDDNSDYLLGGILLGCGLVIGGVVASLIANRQQSVSGKEVLEDVKAYFEADDTDAPIEGSWIELKPIPNQRYGQEQNIYFGGLSRTENKELVQYEFKANAENGQILEIYKVK